ncbi:MAG: signal peptidase II, partial [Oscillospiraceae bacterium]|nr:signal peptidase II [Oscillospiraceae bacterium]
NTGAAFSFFTDMRWPLTIVTVILAAAIVVFLLTCRLGIPGKAAAGAVLGGAVGNLIDRFVRGFVVDMIEVEFIRYPVFNVADCFIVVGAIVFFVWYLFFDVKKPKGEKKPLMPEIERLSGGADTAAEDIPAPDDYAEPEAKSDDGKDG